MPVRPGGILGLDLSGICGWAYGHRDDATPLYGRWLLPEGHNLGLKFVAYENELIKALARFRPMVVGMEAPLPANRQASTYVARQQFGLAGYTEGECARAKVPLREQPAHMVRKLVLGRGGFGSSEAAKDAVMAWCHAQGWSPPDDNAGDALVLWRYYGIMQERAARNRCAPNLRAGP